MAAIRTEDRVLDQMIPTRLDVFTHNRLLAEAKHQKITRTALVRLAIRDYLKMTEAPNFGRTSVSS